VYETTSKICSN